MNELEVIDDIKIKNMIYKVRGKEVMRDSDLAKLYQCKNVTKSINLAVKRHINRFPEDLNVLIPVENNSTGYIYVGRVLRGLNEFDGCIFIEGDD